MIMSYYELSAKRRAILRDIDQCNRMLVEAPTINFDHMCGIHIRDTLERLTEHRRLIIICCLDRLDFELRRVTYQLKRLREE